MNATREESPTRQVGEKMVRAASAGFFVTGLVAMIVLSGARLEHGSFSFLKLDDVVVQKDRRAGAPPPSQVESATLAGAGSPSPAAAPPRLSAEMARVRDFVAQRYRVAPLALEPLLHTVEETGMALGLDPMLLIAVMAVESRFNPLAQSQMGAQGLMQVIPRYHLDKVGENARADALLDPAVNIRVGAMVLKEGMQRFGSLQGALQYYNGALSDPSARYANQVLALKARLKAVARRPSTVSNEGIPAA